MMTFPVPLTVVDLGDLPLVKAAAMVFDEVRESRGCCVVVDADLVAVLAGIMARDNGGDAAFDVKSKVGSSRDVRGVEDIEDAETLVGVWRVGEGGRPMEGVTLSCGDLYAFSRGLRNIAFYRLLHYGNWEICLRVRWVMVPDLL